MLCSVLNTIAPCFLFVSRIDDQVSREGQGKDTSIVRPQSNFTLGKDNGWLVKETITCHSRCGDLNRVIPSYALTTASIDMILMDSEGENNGSDLVFPIDVEYDFKRREWIDNSDETPITQLPWVTMDGVYYPLMNDILLITHSAYKSDSVVYMVDSSTQCEKRPESCSKRNFYCINKGNNRRSELQRPMTHVDAIARCVGLGGSVDARLLLPSTSKSLPLTLWTGALRYNASHFQRHDGVLIEPAGFIDSYRDFPSIVHARITRDNDDMLQTYNSLRDAYNQDDSDQCLCFLKTSGLFKQLIKHKIFIYISLVILLSFFFVLFLQFKS